VLARNIVVIVLQLFEIRLMVTDELIDMQVFTFFNLMDLHFELQLQFFFEFRQPLLEFLFSINQLSLIILLKYAFPRSILFFELFAVFNVLFLLLDVLFLEIMFNILHDFDAALVVIVLLGLGALAILLDIPVGALLLVLEMAHFLKVYLDFGVVVLLHGFGLGLAVQDLQLELFDFGLGVLVVLFHHVAVHLDVVPFGLEVVEPVLG
jgi:hypothetical protein